jgi:hypothetical protein
LIATTTIITGVTSTFAEGDPITVDVSVGAGSGTPTGSVTVSDGGTQTCDITLDNGVGSCQITETTGGQYTFTADYGGDPSYALSDSDGFDVTVGGDSTTTDITGATPLVAGQAITIGVSVVSDSGTPTGTVTVGDGTQTCVATLDGSGDGSCQITETTSGSYTFTAVYNGDTDYVSSDSDSTDETVAGVGTTTSITSTTASPVVGQPISVAVSVAGDDSGIPTGSVTVSDGTQSCPAALDGGGTGSCQITETAAGSYTFTASYPGDSTYASSTTLTGTNVTVGADDTTTVITSTTPSPVVGELIAVTVGVTADAPGSGIPAGSVLVSDGTQSCPVTLLAGAGSCQITETAAGDYSFTASYGGDTSDLSSNTAAASDVTVAQDGTTASITGTTGSPVVGQLITVDVSVAAKAPGSGTPTGSVLVSDGDAKTCTVNLAAGSGSCQITETAAGPYDFTASYDGDGAYLSSSTAAASEVTVGEDDTTSSITSTSPSPVVGQPITVGVSVAANAPGSGTPTGTVTIDDGGTQSCQVTLTAGGGTCVITEASAGGYTLTATYGGDAPDFASSVSTGAAITVAKDATSTAISDTTANPVVGQPITVSVSVGSKAPGAGTPTGTVTVHDGGIQSCTADLSGGTGSCTITEASAGGYSFTATYSGDAGYLSSSTAASTSVTVGDAGTTTSITDTTSNPVVGEPILVSVSVAAVSPGSGTPTGSVTVHDGTQTCAAPLTAGIGSCTITEVTAGSFTFTAGYVSDGNFLASTTATGTGVSVAKDATTTSITSTTSAPVVGQPITVHVSVLANAPGSGAPTGTVTVSDGGSKTCRVTLIPGTGVGSCPITETAPGAYSFTAGYAGDSNYLSSGPSAGFPLTVDKDATTTSITSTTPTPVVGQTISVHVSVVANGPGNGTPTGTVTVHDGGTQSCSAPLTDGAGSCPITESVAKGYSFTASYPGDVNDLSSSSTTAPVTVEKDATATTITSATPASPVVGQPITIAVSVAPVTPGSGTPTGSVTVGDGGSGSCVVTLSSGAGTCQITETAPGPYSFSANYTGDSNDLVSATSTGTAVSVDLDQTTTVITGASSTFVVGAPITISVSVVATAPGIGIPTGDVLVGDGAGQTCTVVLSDGSGSCPITETAAAKYSFTAGYGGDSNDYSSSAPAYPVTIGGDGTVTTITGTTFSGTAGSPVVGQPITVSVSVVADLPDTGAPTGTATVSDGGFGTCEATLSGGSGSCAITENAAGPYSFTATYSGSVPDYSSSNSSGVGVTVGQDSTTTSITGTTPAIPVVGEPIVVNVTVAASSPGSGEPTGRVTVTDGTQNCVVTLSADAGSCQITETAAGPYSFTANYGGDLNDVTSGTATGSAVTVSAASTTTSITSATSSVAGQPMTVTVNVGANAPGAGTPTGTVTVSDGGAQSCPVTLSAGAGSCQITEPAAGSYSLSASYAGGSDYSGSTTSSPFKVTVGQASSTVTLTVPTGSPVVGQPMTFGVTVTAESPGAGTPTRTVTVSDGGAESCVATLLAGSGSCPITEATARSYTFTASYSGDSNFVSSDSPGGAITVAPDATTTTITSIPTSAVVGQPITVAVEVAANVPGGGFPTGTVTVSDGTKTCPVTLGVGTGTGSCKITETAPSPLLNPYSFTASYQADDNYVASTSDGSSVTVGKDATTTRITSTTKNPVVGQPISVTVAVAAKAPGAGIPTGTVTVSDGTVSCTAELSEGTGIYLGDGAGNCAIPESAFGQATFTATYQGDENDVKGSFDSAPVTVGKASTTVTLDLTSKTATYGDEEAVQASVTVSPEYSGSPTHTVTVMSGTTTVCTITLSSAAGSCKLAATALGAGSQTLTATYGGDLNFTASPPVSAPLTILAATTRTTLSLSGSKMTYGDEQALRISVAITPEYAASSPTGTVTVKEPATTLCTITLAAGKGSCVLPASRLGAGTYHLVAIYTESADFKGSTSSSATVTVLPATTKVAFGLSKPRTTYGDEQVSRLSATVSPEFRRTTPTGKVTIKEGARVLCVIKLSAGKGSRVLSAAQLSAGTYHLIAIYGASSDFKSSESHTETMTVARASTRTGLGLSAGNVTYGDEQAERFSVAVYPQFAHLRPTGTVTITRAGRALCVIGLSSAGGSCTLSSTELGAGGYQVEAQYRGSSDFNGSSVGGGFSVSRAGSSTSIGLSTSRVTIGDEQAERVSVDVRSGSGVTPSGSVTVRAGGATVCVVGLSGGRASCTLSSTRLGAGSYRLGASYGGSADFSPSGSGTDRLNVAKATTGTGLSLSTAKVDEGSEQAEHISVSVSGEFGLSVGGTVRVTASGATVCVIGLSGGRGSCSLSPSQLAVGTYHVVASFQGSGSFDPSSSAARTLTVKFVLSVG